MNELEMSVYRKYFRLLEQSDLSEEEKKMRLAIAKRMLDNGLLGILNKPPV